MDQRFTKLFSLPERLYSEGSPVIISAGALLLDNVSGKILVQLKFRKIDNVRLHSLKVEVVASDTAGRVLGEPVIFPYLDLQNTDVEFGSKTPVYLPDNTARFFKARVVEAVLDNGTVWEDTVGIWESLPVPTELNMEPELLKQYKLEYGQQCRYKATKVKDLWYCTCGKLSRKAYCTCGKTLKSQENIDINKLTELMNKRLEEEKKIKLENDVKEKKRREKNKKVALILGMLATIVCVVILWFTDIKPGMDYDDAIALMEDKKYDEASIVFEQLNGYKDSYVKRLECLYYEAVNLMDVEKYKEAIDIFESILEYQDSSDRLYMCKEVLYNEAVNLMKEGEYDEAVSVLEFLNGHNDSEKKIYDCLYNKAVSLIVVGEYAEADALFKKLGVDKTEAEYIKATTLQKSKKYDEAIAIFETLGNYKDSAMRIQACEIRRKTNE